MDFQQAVQEGVNKGVVEQRILSVCEAVGAFIAYWGFKAIHGRIWALLALRAGPMSQIEISQTLGVSRSLISGSITELTGYGLVRAIGDGRNARLVAVLDVWSPISEVLRNREWMLVESARLALEAALEEIQISRDRGHPPTYDPDRIRLLLGMTEIAQSWLKVLIRIRSPGSLDSYAKWIRSASTLLRRVGRKS